MEGATHQPGPALFQQRFRGQQVPAHSSPPTVNAQCTDEAQHFIPSAAQGPTPGRGRQNWH